MSRSLENKHVLRELAFRSLRDGQFRSLFDTSNVLRTELHNVRVKHRKFNELKMCMLEKIGKPKLNNEFQTENIELRENFKVQEQSECNNNDIYLKKIG